MAARRLTAPSPATFSHPKGLPLLWCSACFGVEEGLIYWCSRAGTSTSGPVPPHPETASRAMMGTGTHCGTRTTSHGHSSEANLGTPEGGTETEVSTPSPWWGLCCFSSLLHGFPWHLRASPRRGSWSCQSSSGCVHRVPAWLCTGMLVYFEQQIFLLTVVGARLSRREDRA